MRNVSLGLFFLMGVFGFSQDLKNPNAVSKTIAISETIKIDSVSINPFAFKIMLKDSTVVNPSAYKVDFATSQLTFITPKVPAVFN